MARGTTARIRERLARLYGAERATELDARLAECLEAVPVGGAEARPWSPTERDSVLITYGDVLTQPEERPLVSLKRFCDERLRDAIDTIHVLPFCPWSSDGGFSVIDYRQVDPRLGTWEDLEAIAADYRLMADLVLNHCSSQSEWFRNYRRDAHPGAGYFIEVDPGTDLSSVVRPRPWPLLTRVDTRRGPRWVWTTFSRDQIDLDWSNPEVLCELVDVALRYLAHGVRILRLDAVAFLWKELGTSCIHRPETHEVVRLLRDLLTVAAPDAALLTETNVPHAENVSYFGDGDEAHLIYQFTLPPLLLFALLREDASLLARWLRELAEPPPGCSFLNFTASHDGVGLRPLEGIVDAARLSWLVDEVSRRGGLVSRRRMPDGSEQPYELNVTYRDALAEPQDEELGIRRFLCSQAVVASLRGIPAFYVHSFLGTHNWHAGVEAGERRDINRRRFTLAEVEPVLARPGSSRRRILGAMVAMLRIRRSCSAFHPRGPQAVLETDPRLLAVVRTSPDGAERVLCWVNATSEVVALPAEITRAELGAGPWRDRLAEAGSDRVDPGAELAPYQVLWLTP